MKQTPFTKKHIELGAKMAEFAGYNMPISYTGINDEHQTVRNNAGVFDVSHMGEFLISGEHALELIQRVTTNDASKLRPGQAQYSCLTNQQGGIIDDLIVYCLELHDPGTNKEAAYMLVVNAANIEKDWNWITAHNHQDTSIQNISDSTALLAIQGPNAIAMLQPLTDLDLMNLKYYRFVKGSFAGVEDVIISATGYTGSGGVEIYFAATAADADNENSDALKIWNAIFREGSPKGLKTIGLAARDTLRLEMGFCLYGNDLDDTITPLEAGLGWITKFVKDFPGREILEKQKSEGVTQKLVGFEMLDRGIPRLGYTICDQDGHIIGKVTSGTQAPSLNKAIGMGYVETSYAPIGSDIFINVRDKMLKATVVKLPFA